MVTVVKFFLYWGMNSQSPTVSTPPDLFIVVGFLR
jgi:hypothetical protein